MNNIVLVHGGFVDGSGWESVYQILKGDGYQVSIVQNPTISLEDDVAVTRRILAAQDGPAILVGRSYGGAVTPKPETIPRLRGSCISPPLLRTRASPWPRLSKILRPAHPYRRYCLRRTAICSSTGRSSALPSQPMWTQKKPLSWLTLKSHGAWRLSAARSANRRGRPSRAGT